MTTTHLVHDAGALAVLLVLLVALAVVVLRLLALPLAVGAYLLDAAADATTRVLPGGGR